MGQAPAINLVERMENVDYRVTMKIKITKTEGIEREQGLIHPTIQHPLRRRSFRARIINMTQEYSVPMKYVAGVGQT
jgi:hypothetical protein